jgi:ketosteroid isomerase-like protein
MQTVQDMEQYTTAQAFAAHLALIGKDIQAWVDLFAEDAVVEFPYTSALSSPERLQGKSAIYNYMKDVLAQMQNLIFTNIRACLWQAFLDHLVN